MDEIDRIKATNQQRLVSSSRDQENVRPGQTDNKKQRPSAKRAQVVQNVFVNGVGWASQVIIETRLSSSYHLRHKSYPTKSHSVSNSIVWFFSYHFFPNFCNIQIFHKFSDQLFIAFVKLHLFITCTYSFFTFRFYSTPTVKFSSSLTTGRSWARTPSIPPWRKSSTRTSPETPWPSAEVTSYPHTLKKSSSVCRSSSRLWRNSRTPAKWRCCGEDAPNGERDPL